MFQSPKNNKSEFSQLPSFGQIANTSLQAGKPLTTGNFHSTSAFTPMTTYSGIYSSQPESSAFRNPSVFSSSSFPSKPSSILFTDQTKSPTNAATSQPCNPFASVSTNATNTTSNNSTTTTTTTTNPLAGIFGTRTTTQLVSFSSSPPSLSVFNSSTSPSSTFGTSSKTDSTSMMSSKFGDGGATSSTVSLFGQGSTSAPPVKSNLFAPSSTVLFAPPTDGSSTQLPFSKTPFDSSSKQPVFSSQLGPGKSAVSTPSWNPAPTDPSKTNPFIKNSSTEKTLVGQTAFSTNAPSFLFQSPPARSSVFQQGEGSSVFSKTTLVSSTAATTAFESAAGKVFSSAVESKPQKSGPVTSSGFSQSSNIGQTVSKIFGSEGHFSAVSVPPKDTKVDNTGLFGKTVDSKSSFTKAVSRSSEFTQVSSPPSYEVGLFGKPEKKLEQPSEDFEIPGSHSTKVGLFGKQLAPKEFSETEDRSARKRSVSPKRPWSKASHSSRHEKESYKEPLYKKGSKPPFGRLYSEIDNEMKPASSRLHIKNEIDDDISGHSRRTLSREERKTSTDQSRTSKRAPFSRQISEDDESKVALVCKNIPPNFNRGAILQKHFSRFGKIARIIPNPPKRSANVHFKDHESARNAKYDGTVLAPGVRIQIFWHSGTRRASTSYKDLDAVPTETENLSPKHSKSSKSAIGSKKRSWLRNEVEEELQLMAGTHDIKEELVNTLDRPSDPPLISPPPLAPPNSTLAASISRPFRSFQPKTVSSAAQSSTTVPENNFALPTAEIKKATQSAPSKPPSSLPLRKTENPFKASSNPESLKIGSAASCVKFLDLYDRAVRKQIKKRSSLSSAIAVMGTCPDMCPEKERYDREAKRRLHIFEIVPGTKTLPYPKADHARVVKEYSRSSADQEEPLPHELRPASVLVRTMTYLLTEIAIKGEDGKWADWYDFLWDRTRGIRKDITQQMMCNVEAVSLIEKCARFHIFSAERLCEEQMSVFSHKINDENLTKCLQSLKYLYADMERKHKIYFETEAEFRAYVVLMNLNQGDMLREVQKLRPDILRSPEIQFALQVYSAINSNNYIKFFKLIKKATFLNACILHRYFPQVRSKALMILMRALTPSSRPVPYPMKELVKTLGFESETEANTFCEHYGFVIENSDILLDRASFVVPETAPASKRSIKLVESKSNWSIGEVINGGTLLPYELLTPVTSFDKDGNPKPEILAKNVKEISETVSEKKAGSVVETTLQLPAVTVKSVSSSESQVGINLQQPIETEESPFQKQEPVKQQERQLEVHHHHHQQQQQQIVQQFLPETLRHDSLPEQTEIVKERPNFKPLFKDSPVSLQKPSEITAVPLAATQSSAAHMTQMKQSNLDIKELARDMFLEVIGEFATSIAEESIHHLQSLNLIANEILEQTQQIVIDGLLRELSQQVCEEISLEQQLLMEKLIQEQKQKLLEEQKRAEAAALQRQKEALEAKRLAEEQQRLERQREEEERTRKITEEFAQEILDAHLADEVKQIAHKQMEQVEKELRDKTIEECSQHAKTTILHEVIDEMCSKVGQEIYTTDVERRLKELEELEYCVGLYQVSKVLQRWKRACIVQQQRRYSLQTFPACPSFIPLAGQLKKLCGPEHSGIVDESLLLNKRARLSIESPMSINRRDAYLPVALTLCRLRRHLIQQKAWYPLDIQSTAGSELLALSNWKDSNLFNSSMSKNKDCVYWKLLLSFPELDEEADDIYTLSSFELCDWIKSKLTKGARPESTMEDRMSILSLYKLQLNGLGSSFSPQKILHFCVRSVTGILDSEDIEQIEADKLFLGASGLLYILPVMKTSKENIENNFDNEDEEIYWLEEQTRLATLLQAKPIKPSVPLAVVMPRHKELPQLSLKEFIKKMNLQKFIDQELISSVLLFTLPFCLKTPGIDVEHFIAEEKLSGSLKWLASRIPKQPLLEKKRFKDYVEDFLSKEFYGPVLYNQKIRQRNGYLQQSPHVIIDLYNSVIDHLTACATEKDLCNYSWPVPEFLNSTNYNELPSAYWNSEEHLLNIGNMLLMLKLPDFMPTNELNIEWSHAIEDVWNYIRNVIGDDPKKQAVELVSKVRNLLVRIETRFSEACLLEFGQEGCLPTAENMEWLDIILYCINHLLMTTSCLDMNSLDDQECPQEIEVVYCKSSLDSYKPDVAWRDAAAEKMMEEGPTLNSTYMLSVSQMVRSKMDESTRKTRTEPSKFSLEGEVMRTNRRSVDQLKICLNAEKRHSHHFEDFLERSLHEGFFEEEDDISSRSFHSGQGDGPTVMNHFADRSKINDRWPINVDPLNNEPIKSVPDGELLSSGDFEAVQSLEERITNFRYEIESCKRSSSFMECCLNSLLIDPLLGNFDLSYDIKKNDTLVEMSQ